MTPAILTRFDQRKTVHDGFGFSLRNTLGRSYNSDKTCGVVRAFTASRRFYMSSVASANRGVITATATLDPLRFVGFSALEIRSMGCELDDSIPDLAVIDSDGAFSWTQITYTVS